MRTYRTGGITPPILNFGTRWTCSKIRTGLFTSREIAPVPIQYEAMWAPKTTLAVLGGKKTLISFAGNRTAVVQSSNLCLISAKCRG